MYVRISLAVLSTVAFSTALGGYDFESTRSDFQNRIVGGQDAKPGQFPYQVSLRCKGKHICGASIIDEKWILTAAHCVISKLTEEWMVVAGSVSLEQGGIFHDVAKIITHPLYISKSPWKNDLALFKLEKALIFSNNIYKIPLETYNVDNVNAVISGWGLVDNFVTSPPDNLQYIQTRTISLTRCSANTQVDQSQICISNKIREGPCKGDSGGPLVANGKQIGVASYILSFCGSGFPSVFTSTAYFNKWIESTMKDN